MDHMMTPTGSDGLRAQRVEMHWAEVPDGRGGTRLEMRWTAPAAPAAPAVAVAATSAAHAA